MRYIHLLFSLISGFIAFVLVFRILFKLFAANGSASFVAWVYSVSGSLIAPFYGIIPPLAIGRSTIDFTTVIALLVYVIGLNIISEILYKHVFK